jgi:GAF domain-containing protein
MPSAADRLQLLYEVNRRLATVTDLEELLRYATRRAREVFEAEGCALLLLDAERREFHFPVASQSASGPASESRLAEVRFPADQGVAGWVLAHGESVMVEDVAGDPRFYPGVDQMTRMTTRALLCAPLRTEWGTIGVIEVVNPPPGSMSRDDLDLLEALASDIAVAHEKVQWHERLRGEVISLRQTCRWAGVGLVLVGVVLAVAVAAGQLAWALPFGELLSRPAFWAGLVTALVGLLLAAIGRGWLIGKAPEARLGRRR